MQYHIILLLAIFYRIACVRWVRARKLSYWFFICALQHYCRNLYIFSFGLHLTIYLILSTLLLLMRWQLLLELKRRVVRFPFVICNFSVRVLFFSSFFFIFFYSCVYVTFPRFWFWIYLLCTFVVNLVSQNGLKQCCFPVFVQNLYITNKPELTSTFSFHFVSFEFTKAKNIRFFFLENLRKQKTICWKRSSKTEGNFS